MKKNPLLVMLFALMANFAMAQIPSLSLSEPIDTSSITTSSIIVEAQQFNGGGAWHIQAQPQQVGTTVWIERDTSHYFGSYQHVTEIINNLSDSTNYRIRLIVYDSAYVDADTLYYADIVTTRPLPRHAQIISASSISMLPKSGYKVTGAVIGQPGVAWALHATTFVPVTDTIPISFTTGLGYTDTLSLLFDSANMVHPAVRIYMKGLTDNWTTASAVIPGFSSPAYTNPVMISSNLVTTKDSIFVNLNISSIGNTDDSLLSVTITDTVGNTIVYQTLATSFTVGTLSVKKGGLISNHWYHLTAIATNKANRSAIVSFSFKTSNVLQGTVVASVPIGTTGYTDYTVKALIDSKGTGDSSAVKKAWLLEGSAVVDSQSLNITDTATITFHQTNKLSGYLYSGVKVKIVNGANLTTTSNVLNITTLAVIIPAMTNSTPVKTTDSIYTMLTITNLGNGGAVNLNIMLKDLLSGVLVLNTSQVITSTGTIPVSKGGLMSNRWYEFVAILFNTYGSADTITFTVKTDNVNVPKATVAVGAQAGYYDYHVDVFLNPQGNWDSSQIKKLYLYESSSSSINGTLIDSMTLALTDTATVSFHKTGKQASTDYWMKAKVVNLANLSYTSTSVKVSTQTMTPDGIPHITAVYADDASTLRVTGMTYNINPDHTANIRLLRETLTTQGVDTVDVLFSVTGTGSVAQKIMTDAIGDYTYRLTIFSESNEGIVWGNSVQQHMPLPELNPILADVTKGNASDPAHAIAINVFGDRGGNACTMSIHWYIGNVEQVGSPFVTTNLPGTFNYPYLLTDLLPSTLYKIIVELDAAGGGAADPITRQYATDASTGIEEIPLSVNTIAPTQLIRAWNLLGQEMGYGEFQNLRPLLEQNGGGVFVVVLYNETGKAAYKGKLPIFGF